MSGLKRIFLFILTNIMIMATISIILNLLGVRGYMTANGINYSSLLIFCLVWGMAGSFISLLISKWMAKTAYGVRVIDPATVSGVEGELVSMVRKLSQTANIPMPEIGIYESPEVNAFATGPTKNSAIVAVSTGLLQSMNRNEIEGVIGHEISHISNGDMVTMTLIQGLVNSFAMFLSRVASFVISKMVKEDLEVVVRVALTFLFDIVFTILGSLVVAYFSRIREYKADRDSAKIGGKSNMISALRSLQKTYGQIEDNRGQAIASLKISGNKKFLSLFSTHPALEDRIAALEKATF